MAQRHSTRVQPRCTARALRDFGPGRACENDPFLGSDPQPKHMRPQYTGTDDNGGVHLNPGIVNHAFSLLARAVSGQAWTIPGAIGYEAMRKLSSDSGFAGLVATTDLTATARPGQDGTAHRAVRRRATDRMMLNPASPACA